MQFPSIIRFIKLYLRNSIFLLQHIRSLTDLKRFLFLLRVFAQCQSELISLEARKKLTNPNDGHTYGEIDFISFAAILNRAGIKHTDVFVDLGSGAGKALQTAAIYFSCKHVIGVEMIPELVAHARSLVMKAKKIAQDKSERNFLKSLDQIQVVEDNFLTYDYSLADVVFINATCFSPSTWTQITHSFLRLKKNSRVIVTTKEIKNEQFLLLDQRLDVMSWGMSRVSIYSKTK